MITLTGNIDAMTSDQIASSFSERVTNGQVRILVDLGGVDFKSSAGLRAILLGMKEARKNGGDLRLAGAQPGIEKVLKLSGFTSIHVLTPPHPWV